MSKDAWGERLLSSTSDRFNRWEQQHIALAAVVQCAVLVNNLANNKEVASDDLVSCINPLLALNPASIDEIYPNVNKLNLGFKTLQDIFSNEKIRENTEVIRYTLGMLILRNKLNANRSMQNEIREVLKFTTPLATDEEEPDKLYSGTDNTYEQLAELYLDTLSKLSFRIQVHGKIENLKDEYIVNKIRTLLLAGVRSAFLWYQLGGRRWRLVIHRKQIRQTVATIRRKLISPI